MKRDMMKIAGESWKGVPERYQPGLEDFEALKEMIFQGGEGLEALWNAFGILFRYGFQLGRRYEKRNGRKLPVQAAKGYRQKVTEQIGGMTERQAELVYHFMVGLSGVEYGQMDTVEARRQAAKVQTIRELDSLQTETASEAAAAFVHRLAEKEQGQV